MLTRREPLASYRRRERTVSGLFGEHDPVLGQGALPPFAGRRVGGGAQVHQSGGEPAAGAVQVAALRRGTGNETGEFPAGVF